MYHNVQLLSLDADNRDLCAKTDDAQSGALEPAAAAEGRGDCPTLSGVCPVARRNVARHGPAPSSLHICATDP